MNVTELILANSNSFTKSEQKIADFILDNKGNNKIELSKIPLNEFAQMAGVGQATIGRFIRKLGFDTFSELKIALKRDLYEEYEFDKEKYYIEKQANAIFEETMRENDLQEYTAISDLVWKAEHVYCYGIGSSNYVSQMFSYYLFRTGKNTRNLTERHELHMAIALAKTDDVLFLISRSAQTIEILEAIKYAYGKCRIVLITENKNPKYKEKIDHFIFLPLLSQQIQNVFFRAPIVQLCAINKWFDFYVFQHKEDLNKVQDKMTASIGMFNEELK